MYRDNVGKKPPKRSRIDRILDWLERISNRRRGYLTRDDLRGVLGSVAEDKRTFARLPHAELTEEQRKAAAEEIRRRPRIG